MDESEIISCDFINARLNGQEKDIPKTLYKYRPFDEHTFDMLENDYLFLCKAERLDDPSECMATVQLKDYYDLKTGSITPRVVDGLLSFIQPYTTKENYEQIRNVVYRTITPNGCVRRNFLVDEAYTMQKLVPNVDMAPVINWLANIPEKMNEPEIKKNIDELLFLAYDARQKIGICSLTELSDSPDMWEAYADKSSGYCVEYAMDEYEYKSAVFPVVYSDERNTDIVSSVLDSFLGQFIFGMSNGQIQTDKSQYIRLFLTKNKHWKYQNEWRILGGADTRMKAPKVIAVHLGKDISNENRIIMENYCKHHNIALVAK